MHKIVGADAHIRPFLKYCNFLQRDDVGIVPYIVVERLFFYLGNFMNNHIKNQYVGKPSFCIGYTSSVKICDFATFPSRGRRFNCFFIMR